MHYCLETHKSIKVISMFPANILHEIFSLWTATWGHSAASLRKYACLQFGFQCMRRANVFDVCVYQCLMMLCGNICDSYRERENKRDDRLVWRLSFPSFFCEAERIKGTNKRLHYGPPRSFPLWIRFDVTCRICNHLSSYPINHQLSHSTKMPSNFLKQRLDIILMETFGHLLWNVLNLVGKQPVRSSQYFSLKHSKKWTKFIIIIGWNNRWAHVPNNRLASRRRGALEDLFTEEWLQRASTVPPQHRWTCKTSSRACVCAQMTTRGTMETAHNNWKILHSPCFACECDLATQGHMVFIWFNLY